jgi:hypothetical protein
MFMLRIFGTDKRPPRARLLLVGLIGTAVAAGACRPTLTFDQIARSSEGGVLSIAATAPAINAAGTVVFSGLNAGGVECLFAGTGGALTQLGFGSTGVGMVEALKIDTANDVVFLATRAATNPVRGVYATTVGGAPIATLYEQVPGTVLPPRHDLSLSPNGTVAFSTIVDGMGALLRGPVAGPFASVRDGTGIFYNTLQTDVNDAGLVAASMEYGDPTKGLARGILLFSTPNPTLDATKTAVEKLGIGDGPSPALNAGGDVAFAEPYTETLRFYDPPDVADPNHLIATVTLTPGIYLSHPTTFGTPSNLTQLASTTDGFATFGKVALNASGRFVFEATLPDGTSGIYFGRHPQTDWVVRTKDFQNGPKPFLSVSLGGLNDADQMVFHAVDYSTVHDEIWRVDGP